VAVQITSGALPTRDCKPILRNLKFTAEPGKCILLATDLETAIQLGIDGHAVDEPGEVLLPAKRLLDILRESSDHGLTIEANELACLIRGENTEFEFATEEPAQFPDPPAQLRDSYHEVEAGTLREMIRRTVFATAEADLRYAFTGVLWELEQESIQLVATDGRRLAFATGNATRHGDHVPMGGPHVVPTKAMHLLERNLRSPEETVRIHLGTNEALFQVGPATIYSRLVEGRYPAYRDVIPKKAATKLPLTVAPFLTAIRQAAVMVDNGSRKVIFGFGKQQLTLRAEGPETGRAKVQMPIDYKGKAIEIAFNPEFVTDMLRALEPMDELTLQMTDANSPALFRLNDSYSYVVMPLV
jgi:DNA polymerase-3 subunit beta